MENKAEEFYKTQWTHPEKMDEFYKSRQRFSYNDMIKFASDFASQQKPEIACRFEPMTSISLSDVCKNCGQGKFMHLQNDQQKPVAIHVELLKQLESLADYIPAEVYTKKVIELKTRIQPSDLQKEVERLKKILNDLPDLLHDSLGECSKGNDYEIVTINNERWITHKEVGSGEPLKQWVKSTINEALNK